MTTRRTTRTTQILRKRMVSNRHPFNILFILLTFLLPKIVPTCPNLLPPQNGNVWMGPTFPNLVTNLPKFGYLLGSTFPNLVTNLPKFGNKPSQIWLPFLGVKIHNSLIINKLPRKKKGRYSLISIRDKEKEKKGLTGLFLFLFDATRRGVFLHPGCCRARARAYLSRPLRNFLKKFHSERHGC